MSLPIWLLVIILGIVEGLTEFIPVSSTGHLLIADHLLKLSESSFLRSDLFNIVIQSGAVLAVLPLFRERLVMLTKLHEPQSREMLAKIGVAFFITAVGGLLLNKTGFKLPETLFPVACALLIGGLLFIIVEKRLAGRELSAIIGWETVLFVALAQLTAAAFPGASRSGTTILFAMLLGTTRVAATEFSFLVGIPTMLAAGVLKIHEAMKLGGHQDWGLLALGTIISAIVSFIAVKWLLHYVQRHNFVGFGLYRIILGTLLLLFTLKSTHP